MSTLSSANFAEDNTAC